MELMCWMATDTGAVPLKGQAAGEHLIEHHAGGVDVGAGVDAVSRGPAPERYSGRSPAPPGSGCWAAFSRQAMPKSATFTLPSRSTITLWGLISRWMMPRLWAWLEALHDLGDEVQRLPPVQLAPCFSIYCFRVIPSISSMTIYSSVAALGHVIDRHDVGVGQHGDGLGLVVEPAAELLVLGQVALEDLDGHQAVQAVTLGLVHHGHAARCRYAPESHSGCRAFFQCTDPWFHVPPSFTVFCIRTAVTLSGAPLALGDVQQPLQAGVRLAPVDAPQRASPDR